MINTHQGLCPLYYLVGKKVCGQDQNWVLRQELHWTLQGKPKDFNQAIDYNSGHFPLSAPWDTVFKVLLIQSVWTKEK